MARGLILTAEGYDETQVEYAYHRLREDAILVSIATPAGGDVAGLRGGVRRDTVAVDDLDATETFDLVVVPGGRAPERLRLSDEAVSWLDDFESDDGIVGVAGHGVQLLASVDALDGRAVTGPPELAVDVENAGADYTGETVAVDGNLVTARGTGALPFFVAATISNSLIPQDPTGANVGGERPHWASGSESESGSIAPPESAGSDPSDTE